MGFTCHLKDWDTRTNLPKSKHPYNSQYDSIIAKAIKEHKDKLVYFKHEGKDFTPAVLLDTVNIVIVKTTVFRYFESKIEFTNWNIINLPGEIKPSQKGKV